MHKKYQIEHPALKEFFEKAMEHISRTKAPCSIQLGEPEFAAWVDYFDRVVGKRPIALIACMGDKDRALTVPTKWPEWFDSRAAAEVAQPSLRSLIKAGMA